LTGPLPQGSRLSRALRRSPQEERFQRIITAGDYLVKSDFSEEETRRYSRNVLLAEVGWPGQRRIRAGRVLVVGAGGIGSASLLYLAAAGVGHLGIADGDAVAFSDLQRQILHQTADLGRPKVDSAREALLALNPHCQVQTLPTRLDAANIRDIIKKYEVVLDASDNFATRFLLADCCWLEKVPLVAAAATAFQGQLLAQIPEKGNPCYRCLMPAPPPPEAAPGSRQVGILGAVAGTMGCLQALEALKLLLGRGSDLARRFLTFDGLRGRFHAMERTWVPDCALCGENPSITGLEPYSKGI
jgi:molybdopterin/thiamine biosynthesis adenylyltransferase